MMDEKMVPLCNLTQTSSAQELVPQTEHPRTRVDGCQAWALSAQSLSESLTHLLLYSGMHLHLPLSPGLCWWSLNSPNPGAIGGLLKLHPPQGLLIVCIINTRGLKVCLSAQVNLSILECSSKEAAIGEYSGRALIA